MHNAARQNPWYPAHVSDRADELRGELDEAQLSRLYGALGTMSYTEWKDWIEDSRVEIYRYDTLRRAERKRRLLKPSAPSADILNLKLHHACIWLELLRVRVSERYFHLPPSGAPLDTKESHREMLLAVMAAYHDDDPRDQWPFEYPEGKDSNPFLSD